MMGKYTKKHGVVAAGNRKTAEAAISMLHQGGNAFDAAVAAALACFFTEGTLTSAGGGGFLMAKTGTGQAILFDFFTTTPLHKPDIPEDQLDFYPVELIFGDGSQHFYVGFASMAVPGNLAGLFHIQKKLGKLPIREVVKPAIEYARHGMVVEPFQHYCMELVKPIITARPEGRKIYMRGDALIAQGEVLYNTDYADTLEVLAIEGIREFYEGEIAKRIVADCQAHGGFLTMDDLKNYTVIERYPLKTRFSGWQVLLNPPPAFGGALIGATLQVIERYLQSHPVVPGDFNHLWMLAAAVVSVSKKRNQISDILENNGMAMPDELIRALAEPVLQSPSRHGSTSHLSVIDEDGNVASMTSSVGEGSTYIIPGTGIMMNNMLGETDLFPGGFHRWQPGIRISSNMSPTIALHADGRVIALGTGGANRIRTAILQVLLNILHFKMPVEDAVNYPRIHAEPDRLDAEIGWVEDHLKHIARELGLALLMWQRKNMYFGGVHTVMCDARNGFSGAGDPRRGGVVLYG